MIFAQMKDNIIINTIIINDLNIIDLFGSNPVTGEQYDDVLQINGTYPQPGIGWSFDGIQFYPPPTLPEDE